MKKILTLILALTIFAFSAIGCGNTDTNVDGTDETVGADTELDSGNDSEAETENENNDETPVGDDVAVDNKTPAEIIDAIYAENPVELSVITMDVDLTDPDALAYYTGLKSAEKISAASVSESAFGSQAYSLVIVKVNDAADAKTVAEEMKENIDQRKWCCVEADDMKVCADGNTVMLFMVDSEFADSVTASDLAEAFKTVCGGSVDVEL